jgi:hypothetical protein
MVTLLIINDIIYKEKYSSVLSKMAADQMTKLWRDKSSESLDIV